MRKLHGPIQNQDGSGWIRTNEEIDLLTEDADVFRRIKAQRVKWVWHIVRIDEERTVRSAERKFGWPRYR